MRNIGTKPLKLAVYGDSYTVGKGTSDPSLRWSTLLCHRHGWEEMNEGINGLGFLRRRQDRNGHSEGRPVGLDAPMRHLRTARLSLE